MWRTRRDGGETFGPETVSGHGAWFRVDYIAQLAGSFQAQSGCREGCRGKSNITGDCPGRPGTGESTWGR